MTKWSRVITRIVAFLLLGAIVNVAVTFGFAKWGDMDFDGVVDPVQGITSSTLPASEVSIYRTPGVMQIRSQSLFGSQRDLTRQISYGNRVVGECAAPAWTEIHQRPSEHRSILAIGWPCISLWCEYVDDGQRHAEASIHGGIDLRWRPALFTGSLIGGLIEPPAMPLRPIWLGLLINSSLYAAVLCLLWIAPGKMRRMVRVRRSQCPACGHIIAAGTCANDLCSECGSPLPKGFKPKPKTSAQA